MPAEVKPQVDRLHSSDPQERAWGAYYLGQMGPKAAAAAPALIGILGDRAPLKTEVPKTAARAGILPHLEGRGPGEVAAQALVNLGYPAVPALIAALKEKNSEIGQQVACNLDCLRTIRTAGPLVAPLVIKNEDLLAREELVKALRRITGRDFGADAGQWSNWWKKNGGKAAKARQPWRG